MILFKKPKQKIISKLFAYLGLLTLGLATFIIPVSAQAAGCESVSLNGTGSWRIQAYAYKGGAGATLTDNVKVYLDYKLKTPSAECVNNQSIKFSITAQVENSFWSKVFGSSTYTSNDTFIKAQQKLQNNAVTEFEGGASFPVSTLLSASQKDKINSYFASSSDPVPLVLQAKLIDINVPIKLPYAYTSDGTASLSLLKDATGLNKNSLYDPGMPIVNSGLENNSTNTSDVVYVPADFNINLKSDASVYRVAKGQNFKLTGNLAWNNTSKPAAVAGNSISISQNDSFGGNQQMLGFYLASNFSYPAGTTPDCNQYDVSFFNKLGSTVGSSWVYYVPGLGEALTGFQALKNGVPLLFRDGCPTIIKKSIVQKTVAGTYDLNFDADTIAHLFPAATGVTWPQEKAFVLYPVVDIGSDRSFGLIQGVENTKFAIKYFETQDQLLADCKKEHPEFFDAAGKQTSGDCTKSGAAIDSNLTSDRKASGGVGATILDIITKIILAIISIITTLIYWTFAYVVAPLIEALLGIHPYQDVFVQVIYPGWLILRNISNILFVVIMLIIGLATLFQLPSYNWKSLLTKVVIAAIAVNFSLVMGQAVLGIADTVQNQFLPNRIDVLRSLGNELMAKPVLQIQNNTKDSPNTSTALANATLPFFLLWLALAAFFTFVVIGAFLFIRIIALWILLMTAPIAFAGNILPQTRSLSTRWWSEFIKYAFTTPILAFFLSVAALFANSHVFGSGSPLYGPNGPANLGAGISNFVYLAGGHIAVIAFLFMGLKYAQSSGVYGANKVVGFAQKGLSGGFSVLSGAALAKIGLNKAQRAKQDYTSKLAQKEGVKGVLGKGLFMVANPLTTKKQYAESLKEKMAKSQGNANEAARTLPLMNRDASALWKKVNDKSKEQFDTSEEGVKKGVHESIEKKDGIAALAYIQNSVEEGHLDAVLSDNGIADDELNAKGFNKFLRDLVNKGVITEEQASQAGAKFESALKKKGKAQFAGTVKAGAKGKAVLADLQTPGSPDIAAAAARQALALQDSMSENPKKVARQTTPAQMVDGDTNEFTEFEALKAATSDEKDFDYNYGNSLSEDARNAGLKALDTHGVAGIQAKIETAYRAKNKKAIDDGTIDTKKINDDVKKKTENYINNVLQAEQVAVYDAKGKRVVVDGKPVSKFVRHTVPKKTAKDNYRTGDYAKEAQEKDKNVRVPRDRPILEHIDKGDRQAYKDNVDEPSAVVAVGLDGTYSDELGKWIETPVAEGADKNDEKGFNFEDFRTKQMQAFDDAVTQNERDFRQGTGPKGARVGENGAGRVTIEDVKEAKLRAQAAREYFDTIKRSRTALT